MNSFPAHLEEQRRVIEQCARDLGLDFFETIFEMVDFEQMNQIAAYGGFPQRYPYWRFGMEYERLKKQHTYGLGKIYEMVINNDPCYAYLLTDNQLVDHKTVMAHVYAHCDFFKNNHWFSQTDRKMMDGMANHATRIWRHVERRGYEVVESFFDVCLSLENLIDPYAPFMKRQPDAATAAEPDVDVREQAAERVVRYPAKSYMDRYINPPEQLTADRDRQLEQLERQKRAFPAAPDRDVLGFLLHQAPLEDWEADVLSIVRDEAYYYAPQGQTKIMNEGWATYWHSYMIYEMVINNDPCYAYLLTDNQLVDHKTVMAHVYAHCDFFKNNHWFSQTDRKMMDGMANHATRIWRHVERRGYEVVESFFDVCLSLENLIDPYAPFMKRQPDAATAAEPDVDVREQAAERVVRYPAKSYMDRYINPPEQLTADRDRQLEQLERQKRAFPAAPDRDVLGFLLHQAPLEDWEADVLSIVRDEAYYYAPQGQTKIMNEGWATYWHSYMMTRFLLRDDELITYCDHHSGTLASSPGRLNPYKMGVELFRDIEERWNKGRFGKEFEECEGIERRRKWNTDLNQGREKIFEVRRVHNDVTFIDEFLTPEFVDRHQLYHYRYDPATGRMIAVNRDFHQIKQRMLFMLTNHGQPYIYVVDGNYANRGELYLAHKHIGIDIEIKYANECLKNLTRIWRRPVHLQARIDDEMMLFSAEADSVRQQKISEDLPEPVHASIQ